MPFMAPRLPRHKESFRRAQETGYQTGRAIPMRANKSKSPPQLAPQLHQQPAPRARPHLTRCERLTLEGVLRGASDKLVAAQMGIGVRGVRRHVQSLHAKYKVNSRLQLAAVFLGLHGITTDASPLTPTQPAAPGTDCGHESND